MLRVLNIKLDDHAIVTRIAYNKGFLRAGFNTCTDSFQSMAHKYSVLRY
jgi:hypothetical protein